VFELRYVSRKTLPLWLHGLKDRRCALDNIFLAGVQKTGSQWLLQVFSDPDLLASTGMKIYPQHNYDVDEFHRRFPRNAIVPGLYVSYWQYQLFIDKPERYRTICVLRDPRDLVVSWYHSMLKTHVEMDGVSDIRRMLQAMDRSEGLSYSIKLLGTKLAEMRSWIELGSDDANVLIVRLEEITSDVNHFSKIFSFCGLDFPTAFVEGLFSSYSKANMREKDLAARTDKSESHYRIQGSSYQDEFLPEHYTQFYDITGNLVDALGYGR